MPRRNRRNSRKRGSNAFIRVRGRILLPLTAAAGAVQVDVSTNTTTGFGQFGNKLVNISDNYALFRFTKMAIEIAPGSDVTTTGRYYVGYDPCTSTGAPANATAMIELPWSMPIFYDGSAASPNAFATVIRKRIDSSMLTGQVVKWFHTRTGSFPVDTVNQGTLFFMTPGTTDTLYVVVDYEIEFKDFVQASLTPQELNVVRMRDSHEHTDVEEVTAFKGYPSKQLLTAGRTR